MSTEKPLNTDMMDSTMLYDSRDGRFRLVPGVRPIMTPAALDQAETDKIFRDALFNLTHPIT